MKELYGAIWFCLGFTGYYFLMREQRRNKGYLDIVDLTFPILGCWFLGPFSFLLVLGLKAIHADWKFFKVPVQTQHDEKGSK